MCGEQLPGGMFARLDCHWSELRSQLRGSRAGGDCCRIADDEYLTVFCKRKVRFDRDTSPRKPRPRQRISNGASDRYPGCPDDKIRSDRRTISQPHRLLIDRLHHCAAAYLDAKLSQAIEGIAAQRLLEGSEYPIGGIEEDHP